MTLLTPEEWKRMQKPVKRHKFGARKTSLPGETGSFPSALEAAVYLRCKLRQAEGEIKCLSRYGSIVLSDAKITYKPDAKATYSKTNQDFWIEAKGAMTDRFRLIKKLWKTYGPGPLEIWMNNGKGIYLAETVIPKRKS